MWKTRWAWYALMSLIGVTSAEFLSWSTPVIFPIDPFVFAIYGLHYILIIDYLARHRAITWRALAVGGVVVGFTTESLLTKVIWNPPWDEGETLRIAELGVFEVGFIVLIWHAWLSMAIPFALSFSYFGHAGLVDGARARRILRLLPLTMWLAAALNGANPLLMLLAVALNGSGIVLLAWYYRRRMARQPLVSLGDMVMPRRERIGVWIAITAFYLLLIPYRSEAFPAAGPFALGMALVAGSIALLIAVGRRDAGRAPLPGTLRFSYRGFGRYALAFAGGSFALMVAAHAGRPVMAPLAVGLMMLSVLPGDWYMLRLAWRVWRRPASSPSTQII